MFVQDFEFLSCSQILGVVDDDDKNGNDDGNKGNDADDDDGDVDGDEDGSEAADDVKIRAEILSLHSNKAEKKVPPIIEL